jgi:RNA polymerase sigma-70 factor, ECF subfamily
VIHVRLGPYNANDMMARTPLLERVLPLTEPAEEADWDAVYRRELPRVFNFFRYRVADGATAEDLTSATFEKAWRGRHGYRNDQAAFSTWLFTIARNVAADHFRRRRADVPLDQAAEAPLEADPEDAAVRRSDFRRLEALLRGLPERERELIALKYGAEATNRAIARVTGLSESNVGTILHRTVQTLRAHWHEKEENGS